MMKDNEKTCTQENSKHRRKRDILSVNFISFCVKINLGIQCIERYIYQNIKTKKNIKDD